MEPSLVQRYIAEKGGLCPHCGYNLAGLSDEACPECGEAVVLEITGSRGAVVSARLVIFWAFLGHAIFAAWLLRGALDRIRFGFRARMFGLGWTEPSSLVEWFLAFEGALPAMLLWSAACALLAIVWLAVLTFARSEVRLMTATRMVCLTLLASAAGEAAAAVIALR